MNDVAPDMWQRPDQNACQWHAGSGPYKKWESRPLKAEDGQASTSGEEDDEEVRMPPSRRDKCLRTLFYLNGGLLLFVVIIGAAVVRMNSQT